MFSGKYDQVIKLITEARVLKPLSWDTPSVTPFLIPRPDYGDAQVLFLSLTRDLDWEETSDLWNILITTPDTAQYYVKYPGQTGKDVFEYYYRCSRAPLLFDVALEEALRDMDDTGREFEIIETNGKVIYHQLG